MTDTLQPTTSHRQLSAPQGAWIVAEREIMTRLRSKAFLISTAILLLVVLAGVVIGGLVSQNGGFGGPTKIAVAEGTLSGETASGLAEGFEVTEVADRAAAEQLVRDGDVEAAIVAGGDSSVGLTVIANDSPPGSLVQALSASPTVELLDPSETSFMLGYLIAMGFGMVFYMTALTFGTTIAQSVVEEKQTRIVEILLATISARTMLAGKILGNSILALGTVVATVALAAVGMLATGQDILLGELGTALIWFGILFAFGFVLLAAMYAAAAALVSRQEDIGSVTSPVMMLVMIPFFLIIFFFDNPQVLTVMSYVPFSAPTAMPMRLYFGDAAWWEPIVSLGVLLVSIGIVLWAGSRIYENSIMRTGARVKLADAIKG
ncbi:ABC transporter permease [Leucobacter aridicollis]|uniref:ABC-2 type transport system permease protein n=1 Tax=Leucobacter aridicollis TaxID=283878 RepID=A0A852R084_9MICO|nr:ABC transporter permease [Leucobacter aridicollis]MBL3680874.1 ABC transporter permease [Leucobacter aridicollis]NYD28123.1 ABC-2 type transport system permease protein [Leucobacter aridicollis]